MKNKKLKSFVEGILSQANISINGKNPWDIHIRNEKFYERVLKDGSIGLGESYMDGWWDCDDLIEFFYRLLPLEPEKKVKKNIKLISYYLGYTVFNRSSKSRAFQIGERHYDIGNEVFENMLDKRLVYSCAYWKDAKNLDEAQENKLDLICRKLYLKEGSRVLDIGCGWGSFVKYASEKYGVQAVGITVSKEQVEYSKKICEGLPVEIRLQDYRDLKDEKFDYIVSVGMFEHVGHKNYRTYMEIASKCLKDDGLFLLHTIGNNTTKIACDPWIDKYIFPNSLIPSLKQITSSIEGLFIVEDLHNFRYYYYLTLVEWLKNFKKNWDKIKNAYPQKYDERFYRMWTYYLCSSAASFKCGDLQLWQIVLSKKSVPHGYLSVR
ncbi:MAG: cyclopropane fatty acyl phospholipid synthase [Thermodesulfovibrionales bacterium]|nr:cyclopropane fatty acyl phospholipid synthase [Thermodesulfovibrionales bacterium]